MDKEIVIYSQVRYSPFIALARDLLTRYKIPFREIDINTDYSLADRVKSWVGKISLPAIIVAAPGDDLPIEPPLPLRSDQPTRGADCGSLIVQPNNQQLENWLHKHGFLAKPYKR